MTTVSFMTAKDYKATLQQDVGSLMFSGDYYDAGHHIDKTKLRKTFKTELEGKRIYAVLIHTTSSKGFKNYANTQIRYKNPMFCSATSDGAYEGKSGFTVYDQPVGDAIVVYTEIKPKVKAEKVEGVPTAAELKTLRKEWRDLKEDHKRCGYRPRAHSGEGHSGEEFWKRFEIHKAEYDAKTDAIKKEMFKRAFVLIQHDTPFIKRQMTLWARDTAWVQFLDGKWQPNLGCVMPSYLE